MQASVEDVNAIMPHKKFPYLLSGLVAALVFLGSACASQVGDECASNVECPSGAICDVTVEGGYCTIPDCEIDSCPSNSVCVRFDREESFCMRYCESSSDCRDGYTCRDDKGGPKFCYVPEVGPNE